MGKSFKSLDEIREVPIHVLLQLENLVYSKKMELWRRSLHQDGLNCEVDRRELWQMDNLLTFLDITIHGCQEENKETS